VRVVPVVPGGRTALVVLHERPDPLSDCYNFGSAYFVDTYRRRDPVRDHHHVGQTNDFYEEDEPFEDVLRAFNADEKGLTARPTAGRTENLQVVPYVTRRGWTQTLNVPGLMKLVSDLTTTATPRAAAP
jgi:hypothetical protein